jgi:hypothetical protein
MHGEVRTFEGLKHIREDKNKMILRNSAKEWTRFTWLETEFTCGLLGMR